MRSLLSLARAIAGAALLTLAPAAASAQLLPGALAAQCVGGALACSQVDFYYALTGAIPPEGFLVDQLRLTVGSPDWQLADDLSQYGGEASDRFGPGAPVPYSPSLSADGRTLTYDFDAFAAEVVPMLRFRALFESNAFADASTLVASGALVSGGTELGTVGPADAPGSLGLLAAECVGGALGCDMVQFFAALTGPIGPGGYAIDQFRLDVGGTGWRLADTFSQYGGEVSDRYGAAAPLPFTPEVSADGRTLTYLFDTFAAEIVPMLRVRALFAPNTFADANALQASVTIRTGGVDLSTASIGGPASVVPEPSTWALVGSGLLVLGVARDRRRRAV